jgi:hypothetical protein
MRDLDELLNEHEGEPVTPARQRAFLEAYIDYVLQNRHLVVYVTRDLAVLGRPAIAKRAHEHRRRLEQMLIGTELDFNDQVRAAVAFGGVQARSPSTPTPAPTSCAKRCSRPPEPSCAAATERPRHGRPPRAHRQFADRSSRTLRRRTARWCKQPTRAGSSWSSSRQAAGRQRAFVAKSSSAVAATPRRMERRTPIIDADPLGRR